MSNIRSNGFSVIFSNRREFRDAGIREHDIKLAIIPPDLPKQAMEVRK
jgi:hypothetical protein